jgi:hypothetical protein
VPSPKASSLLSFMAFALSRALSTGAPRSATSRHGDGDGTPPSRPFLSVLNRGTFPSPFNDDHSGQAGAEPKRDDALAATDGRGLMACQSPWLMDRAARGSVSDKEPVAALVR